MKIVLTIIVFSIVIQGTVQKNGIAFLKLVTIRKLISQAVFIYKF
jgi:hypothetical protein